MTPRTSSFVVATIFLSRALLSTSFTFGPRTSLQGSLYSSSTTVLREKHEAMRSVRDKTVKKRAAKESVKNQVQTQVNQEVTNITLQDGTIFKKEFDTPSSSDGESIPASDGEECFIDDEKLKTLGDLEPLERQLIRLEGLEPYVLVSVLTATASYETMFDLEVITENGIDWLAGALLSTCILSTLCGVYTTVVFSLIILYGKTSLGLDRESTYFYFLDQTAEKRLRAFQTFSLSLLFFCVDILLLGIDKIPTQIQLPAAILSASILAFGLSEWDDITLAAGPIFTNVIPSAEKDEEE